ncbi:glycosyltransferase [Idiomarina sp. HP20-50]|uniref:glycosyltransferase n=1 Tax=Idiomarina sp. HP20-50 TaxID=3070813 RepID=UPI00294B369C|nr:glycosyltransferase [Idiomarina sp. HP20-50]MDV6315611.1 glycosyltransferase [Idiomarina sp. HP20-50]
MQGNSDVLANSGFRQSVEVQIKYNGSYKRLNMTLVGQQHPDYLILQLSRQYCWQDILPLLVADKTIGLKTISQAGEQLTGVVDILHMTQYPRKLLFVSYPREADVQVLRSSPRIAINCEAKLQLQLNDKLGDPLPGTVVDISDKGIAFNYRGTSPVSADQSDDVLAEVKVNTGDGTLTFPELLIRSVNSVGPQLWQFGLAYKEKPNNLQDLVSKLLLESTPVRELLGDNDPGWEASDNTLQGESESVQFSTN